MKGYFIRVICGLSVVALVATSAHANPEGGPVVLDSNDNVRSFYGIPVTLTRKGLSRLGFPVKTGTGSSEGTEYKFYTITAQQGVKVETTFDDNGKLYGASTESPNAVGPKGIGVGSTLADVKAAWPQGKFIYGFADGYYVTYVTQTNVLLRFNPTDMPPGAFDHEAPDDFPVPETIKVRSISIYPEPNRMAPAARELLDPNRSWIDVGYVGGITYRLDVERVIDRPHSVKLTLTHKGKRNFEKIVDVSNYPDFDIWDREVVYFPYPLSYPNGYPIVISFRYGAYKACSVKTDDRDKVYLTLDGKSVAFSSSPPDRVGVLERPPMRKYVGNLMKSSAHGCRRTYDPKTGAFGLERVE